MLYKYEMHTHTCACSACGVINAEQAVDIAIESGLSGLVFTNHFYHGNTRVDRHQPWADFVKAYEDDYLRAKEYAAGKGFDVIFGIEELYRPGKEVLIYGIDADEIAAVPEFRDMNIAQMRDFVISKGGVIAAAHPFRHRDYIPDPDNYDGDEYFNAVEIYNHQNTPEDNAQAQEYFKNSRLHKISGADYHRTEHEMGKSGLAFPCRIKETKELAEQILRGNYKLIINGEIV